MATRWENRERVRNGGWYGSQTTVTYVQDAERLCQEIRNMGNDIAGRAKADEAAIAVPPWLDDKTAGLVRAITVTVAQRHPELRAVILYGSVARHDECLLTDRNPSDVDLLFVVDLPPGASQLSYEQSIAVFESVGLARDRYLDAPREVQIQFATPSLDEWDPSFVDNVVREGILLWARGELRARLQMWLQPEVR